MLYVVQSVASRAEVRKRLLADIPPAIVIEDDGPPPPNPWRGYQLCLRAFLETSVSHAVVIQDDAVVCQHFDVAVEQIAEATTVPVCLFVSGTKTHTFKYYLKAMAARKPYATVWFQDFMPVVAVLWPRAKAADFLEWSKDAKLPGMPNPRSDDAVCGAWMRHTKQTVLATVPSLVEHPDDVISVKRTEADKPKEAKSRRALWYIGDDDPLEVVWANV